MSTDARLIYMANQIARNLVAQGEETAVRGTADHIDAFWDPRMKRRLIELGPEGLDAIAAAALALVRRGDLPTPQTLATSFDASGSDAG